MDIYTQPVDEIIRRRYSCRKYLNQPLTAEHCRQLSDLAGELTGGPFGTRLRFTLAADGEQDGAALNGLSTYGFIKNPTAFFIGACAKDGKSLEDFGYAMETLILRATDLGVGTCWVGGVFSRSSFARKIGAAPEEILPAVVPAGYPDPQARANDITRRMGDMDSRLGWDQLFFKADFAHPLGRAEAGDYAEALEMLRLGPSASNHQPWRVVREGDRFHFYLERTQGYGIQNPALRLIGMADIQRIDLGIAMCHFELSARAHGLQGAWDLCSPAPAIAAEKREYTATWVIQ